MKGSNPFKLPVIPRTRARFLASRVLRWLGQ